MSSAEILKGLRKQTGLSQNKFSMILEIPVSNISKWEQGVATPPDYVLKLIRYRLMQLGLIKEQEKNS